MTILDLKKHRDKRSNRDKRKQKIHRTIGSNTDVSL